MKFIIKFLCLLLAPYPTEFPALTFKSNLFRSFSGVMRIIFPPQQLFPNPS